MGTAPDEPPSQTQASHTVCMLAEYKSYQEIMMMLSRKAVVYGEIL